MSFFYEKYFFPGSENYNFLPCGNFYNLLTDSILNHKLNLFDDINFEDSAKIYKNYERFLVDTSFYKGKIYLWAEVGLCVSSGASPQSYFYYLDTAYYLGNAGYTGGGV